MKPWLTMVLALASVALCAAATRDKAAGEWAVREVTFRNEFGRDVLKWSM